MSAMRWFRKYNKRIMVIAGCILMVAFLLPAAFFRSGEKNYAQGVIAVCNDTDGKQVEITQGMFETAKNELKALEMLKISYFNMYQASQGTPLPGFAGIGPEPVLAIHTLLFSSQNTDLQTSGDMQKYRNELYRQAELSDWAEDENTLEHLKESIRQFTAVEPQDAVYYYLLLAHEARQMGIQPTSDVVDQLLELREFQYMKIADILKRCSLQDTSQLKNAVANYVAMVRYCDQATKTLAISEPLLKKNIRDDIQSENISGTYITFRASQFRNQCDEPTRENIEEWFETYKAYEPKTITEENPHGFGYRLSDRVKVEFLMIDLAQVQKGIENRFQKKDILERKKIEQSYWQKDKETYLSQYKDRNKKPQDNEQEIAPEDPQDERNARLEWEQDKVWQKQQALQVARDLLQKAKKLSQTQLSLSDLKQIPPEQRTSHAADYADLAKQLKKNWAPDDPNILYNPNYDGIHLSRRQLYRLGRFSRAEYRRPKQSPLLLADILFQCKPLYKDPVTRIDEAPTELYEDIGPLVAGRTGSEHAVFLVRIVGADPAREPASLFDDGSHGPVTELEPSEDNSMYKQVQRDWKNHQGFSLAVEQANRFASYADPNWADAIELFRKDHIRDPNLPGPPPENSMENPKQQIDRLNQQIQFLTRTIQQNPGSPESTRRQIENLEEQMAEKKRFQKNILTLARQRQEENLSESDRAVLAQKDTLSCLVFKDLKLAPASQQEYLRRKPLNTQQILDDEQTLQTLIHLAPGNIKKRTGFKPTTP